MKPCDHFVGWWLLPVLQSERQIKKIGDLFKEPKTNRDRSRVSPKFLIKSGAHQKASPHLPPRVEPINSYVIPFGPSKAPAHPGAVSDWRHDCHVVIRPGGQLLCNQANVYDVSLRWPALSRGAEGIMEKNKIQLSFTKWIICSTGCILFLQLNPELLEDKRSLLYPRSEISLMLLPP